MQSILTSQYTTARVYFFSILLLLFVEALIRLPLHIRVLFHSGEFPRQDWQCSEVPLASPECLVPIHDILRVVSPAA